MRHATARLTQAGIDAARLEARILAGHVLGVEPAEIPLLNDRLLESHELEQMEQLLARRVRHEPIQYITGTAPFWTLDLVVTPAVLIPRPETEHLVETVLEFLRRRRYQRQVRGADLGTGSGAIALALLSAYEGDLHMYAVDCSDAALEVARLNASRYELNDKVTFFSGSWGEPLLRQGLGPLDFVVSNPPYVSPDEVPDLPPEVRCYEPRLALVGQDKGLEPYAKIIKDAVKLLISGGLLALEVTPVRAERVVAMIHEVGAFSGIRVVPDYTGRDRVVAAVRAPGNHQDGLER